MVSNKTPTPTTKLINAVEADIRTLAEEGKAYEQEAERIGKLSDDVWERYVKGSVEDEDMLQKRYHELLVEQNEALANETKTYDKIAALQKELKSLKYTPSARNSAPPGWEQPPPSLHVSHPDWRGPGFGIASSQNRAGKSSFPRAAWRRD